jgi:nucleotide-binding universal stress UspA family protein
MDVRLVVGWDGSASARRALGWALRQDAEALLVVQVVDGLTLTDGSADDPYAAGERSLTAAVADARLRYPGLLLETRVITGNRLTELARFAGPGTLMVMGDRSRTVLRFRAGWSLGAQLAAFASGPVAIITRDDVDTASGVVVGIDDSEGARTALAFGADWAAQSHGTLHLVHAWEVPYLWSDRALMLPDDVVSELRVRHADLLAGAVAEARRRRPGLDVVGSLVDGTAARVLLDAAAGRSMLVVGDGDVSGFERMLLGSVSHSILLNLTVPTVVIGQRALPLPVRERTLDDDAGIRTGTPAEPRTGTIVAWDGSTPSRSAVDWAVSRERSRGRRVEVVTVADETASEPGSTAAESEIVVAGRAIARLSAEGRGAASGVVVEARVVSGGVLRTLADLTRPDTLLVVGTADRTGPGSRFALSVGAHLLPLARGPVAVVPRSVDPTLSGVAVGVDGSESSDAAVLIAVGEAAARGETLHLVHAWMEPAVYGGMFMLDAALVAELTNEHQSILDAAHLLARAADPGIRIETHLVLDGPARALAGIEPRAAVIVVGSSGRSGWRRAVLGSVGHELVLNLEVPLIIVAGTTSSLPPAGPESYGTVAGVPEDILV